MTNCCYGTEIRKPCERQAVLKGLCRPHYQTRRRKERDGRCKVDECRNPQWRGGQGYCAAHYQRVRRSGSPEAWKPLRERHAAGTRKCKVQGCPHFVTERGVGKRGGDKSQNRGAHGFCVNHSKQYYARLKKPEVARVYSFGPARKEEEEEVAV